MTNFCSVELNDWVFLPEKYKPLIEDESLTREEKKKKKKEKYKKIKKVGFQCKFMFCFK